MVNWLFDEVVAVPTTILPLLITPLFTVRTLPVAMPLPTVSCRPPKSHRALLPETVTVLLLPALPIVLFTVLNNRPPLVTAKVLPLAPAKLPTVTAPTLVTRPPLIVISLPTATPLPIVRLPASMFHVVLPNTLTVLLDVPLPTVTAPLQSCALVTDIVLKPPEMPRTIVPFETTLPTEPPSIL
ncbi:MAG: hypothetical protein PCFJNLEI_04151 [Verrucomicrobiae bacterium]|nr:hypothetical protein [Verrucomicrobiae bacterium]